MEVHPHVKDARYNNDYRNTRAGSALFASRSRVVFEELFTDGATRTEVVVTFLAVLELIRLKQIGVTQDGAFGAIELVKLAPSHSDYTPEEIEAKSEEASPAE